MSETWAGPPPLPQQAATGHEDRLPYHRTARARRGGGWWSVLAIVVAIGGFLAAQVAVVIAFVVYFLVVGDDPQEALSRLVDPDTFEPAGMFFLLASISAAIPIMLLGSWLVAGIRPGFLTSVAGRFRVRWFLVMVGISVLTLLLSVVLGALLPTSAVETSGGGGLNDVDGTAVRFLVIVALLVPFQAAAEEYIFRGLLTQGFGSIGTNLRLARIVAVVGPALIFAAFHGTQSAPIFFDRFAFGVVAGILAIGTGGLEAGIAYHVVNNWLAFGLAILFGDVSDAVSPQGGNGWDVVVSVLKSALFLGLTLAAARAMEVETTVDRTVLVQPRRRV